MTAPNGIGQFVIGQSPIGAQPFDWTQTVISQYANSPTLLQLIADFSAWLDPSADIDAFFDLVWNVDTAQGYGLDIWGRIVDVPRTLTVTPKYFGFNEATTLSAEPFGQAPLYGGQGLSSNYVLSDGAYRQLILAKAAANICDCSIPVINQILRTLFPGPGVCYVTDGGNMTMTYTFSWELTPVQLAIVTQSGVLPRPAGVSATIVQL